MSPKKGIKSNTSNKGNLEDRSWAEMPQLFQNQRLQGKQSYSSSQWNPLLHNTETSKSESHEKICLNSCHKNRSSNENPQRHLLTARQL